MVEESPMKTVTRFLRLFREINEHGPLSVAQMAEASGMPYATTSRIVKTMLHHGLIEREPNGGRYGVAAMALSLSNGFQAPQQLAFAARSTIEALTQRIGWPVMIVTRVGASMVTRASTHHLTSLTFGPCADGSTIPIEHSASGHVFLAHASVEERAGIVAGMQLSETASPMMSLIVEKHFLDSIRKEGYATYERNTYSDHPGKTSAISVPIYRCNELQGALTLVFFASSMPMNEAVRRYLGELKTSAMAIDRALMAPGLEPQPQPSFLREALCDSPVVDRTPTFVATHRRAGDRDNAPAFSNLVAAERRQFKGIHENGAMHT